MTIRKGEPWGAPGALPPGGVIVHSDAEARSVVTDARRSHQAVPVLGLAGGDLCRSVGGKGDVDRLRSPDAMTLPVDLGEVLLDGRLHWFVAHLVAGGPWWRGSFRVAMNGAWVGRWNLGPSAHPNDGLLDTLEASLRPTEWPSVRRRLSLGDHLPHPRLKSRRIKAVQWHVDRAVPVRLDGERVGVFRDISVRIEPDALTVVV